MEENIEKEIKTIVEYCRKRDCSEELKAINEKCKELGWLDESI